MCTICFATQIFDPARHTSFADSGFAIPVIAGPLMANWSEGSDAAENSGTAYTMSVGDTFRGTISNSNDEDWVALNVVEGDVYQIDLTGLTLDDSYLWLHDENGFVIASDDDGGPDRNSSLTFQASTTGTYYIQADAFDSETGTYEIAVTATNADATVGPVGTVEEMALYLTEGFWGGREFTFDTSTSNVITVNITALTAAGQQLAIWATEAWESVANIAFSFVTSGEMITMDDNQDGAFAYTPNPGNVPFGVELNVSEDWLTYGGTTIDSYNFETYVHELGHALGLGHQGDYNGNAQYGAFNGIQFENDSTQMSIMSYFDQSQNTSIDASFAYVLGPMMVDIYAIQELYGAPDANSATAGDTVYGIGSELGTYLDEVFDVIGADIDSDNVSGNPMAITIYDRDGIDTLDFGFSDENLRFDLRERQFSDVGNQIGVIGIAVGTVIENAVLGRGNDTLEGNDADNTASLGAGNDTASGGAGRDVIYGNVGFDTLFGGSDDDVLWGQRNADRLYGGIGDDEMYGGQGTDNMWGEGDNDALYGGSEADRLYGGDGDDTLFAGTNVGLTVDGVFGGDGQDTLYGDGGYDYLEGGDDGDELYGGDQADNLYGGQGSDVLDGGQGLDRLFGGSEADVLSGGTGTDGLFGGSGGDFMYGGDDNDRFFGGSGNDELYGGEGNDTINGGSGFDTLYGGTGDDDLYGRFNADTFVFEDGHGNDTIHDFTAGNNFERIDLSGVSAISSLANLNLSDAVSGAAQQAGSDVFIDTGDGNSITLIGVSLGDMQDFHFIL